MLGQWFRLKTATIATTAGLEKRVAVQLPAGAEFIVLDSVQPDAAHDGQVNVEWDGERISMFLVDIREKGEPIWPKYKGGRSLNGSLAACVS